MSINYNEDFRFLNNSMLQNELVLFVGAGASVGSGYLSWNDLVKDIQDKLGIKESAGNDNTIIPQLYYNSRGKKDYNELIKSLFYKPDAKPNDIHEALVKINPRYIITTNYDDLIEQVFNDKGIFLDVIEKDSDLPYSHTDHLLIKMHGGFKYDNYVLKEEDYLNYSRNFTLIENYIKALFARYTILFIGYSFNDPNTKQIFSWVRSILKEDQQRAYMINVSDEYDSQLFEYYKNMGINVLFAQSILGNNYSQEDYTQDTVCILNEIIVPRFHILSRINNVFKGYDAFNYISGEYIQTVFKQYFTCRCGLENDTLTFICNNEDEYSEASLYFDESNAEKNKSIQHSYPYIQNVFRKSSINTVILIRAYKTKAEDTFISFPISAHEKQDDFTPFEEFNYRDVKIKTIPYLNNTEENHLQKAYCYYFLKDYISCYDILRKAARIFLSTRQLELYLMTENNRIVVGNTLTNNPFVQITDLQRKRIKQEMSSIESYGLYANSFAITQNNKPVSELIDFKYIYKMLYRIIDNCKKVDKEAKTSYYFFAGTKAYDKIEYIISDLYKYMQYNYLFLDIYSETRCVYTLFIDSIFLSLSTKENKNDGLFGTSSNIVLEKLTRFDLMVIFRFLTYDEIKDITTKYGIERIAIEEECYTYVIAVVANLHNSILNKLIPQQDILVLAKLFHILKMVELSEERLDSLYELISVVLDHNVEPKVLKELNSFICKQYNDRNRTFQPEELEKMIMTICNRIIRNRDQNNNSELKQILKNISAILNKVKPRLKLKLSEKDKKSYLVVLPEDVLIQLHLISNKAFQKQIQIRIKTSLEKTKNLELYYNSLMHDVIQPEKGIEDTLFQAISADSDEDSNYLAYCANLIADNKIIDRERFMELIKYNPSLSLVLDAAHFNFSQFEPNMLLALTDIALKRISKNKKAYEFIHRELKYYLSTNWDEKLAKIFIGFFSD